MRCSCRARGELKERGRPGGDRVLIFSAGAVIASGIVISYHPSGPLSSAVSINRKG